MSAMMVSGLQVLGAAATVAVLVCFAFGLWLILFTGRGLDRTTRPKRRQR